MCDTLIIDSFFNEYRFLNTYWLEPFEIDGFVVPSAEHYILAESAAFQHDWERILDAESPAAAKALFEGIPAVEWGIAKRADWVDDRDNVMLHCMRHKFSRGSRLAAKLLDTGDIYLLNNNLWHDNYWGNCVCGRSRCTRFQGQNRLGEILMVVRNELRAAGPVTPGVFVVTFTGHRDCDEARLRPALDQALRTVVAEHNIVRARVGMAQGGDTIFGEACMDLSIPFDAYIPDPGYYSRSVPKYWKPRFCKLKHAAESVHYSSQVSDWHNNFKRNEDMIRGTDLVFAGYRYDNIDRFTPKYRPEKGGTAHGIMTALATGHVLGESLIVFSDC